MKNASLIATAVSATMILTGCASNGGFVTSANSGDGCNTVISSGVGALLGAAAGYAISKNNDNSSAQNNTAMVLGALAGGALAGGICVAINAKTVQKKSALEVEQQYKAANGSLPMNTRIEQYSTSILPGNIASSTDNIVLKSDLRVIEGRNDKLQNVKETLVLKDAEGKVLKSFTKDVSQTGSFGSGEFENSFAWKFPANVSKGQYTIETQLLVNGNPVANKSKKLTLV